jgi:hypothetical protein
MKKLILFHMFVFVLFVSYSQNIGIGTLTPSAKLTVAGSETTADGQGAAIRLWNTSSANSWYLRSGAAGTNTPNGGFSIADNSGYHFNIANGGNIGIGILPTTAKFHVNGEMRLQGLNLFEFGAGVPNKEVNAGKIGYNAFGQNGLVFIGGGSTNLNRSIFFFAEGGTTMNGPLNFNGPLRVNGSPGTAGQVLTSNGTSVPEWTNSSFSNNVRFAASFTTPATFPFDNAYTSIYNTSGADVTIAANTITINKTGLYHFEGYATGVITFTTLASLYYFRFSLFADGVEFEFSRGDEMPRISSSIFEFSKTIHFSQDLYITAPAIVRPEAGIGLGSGGSGATRSASGKITGYLISE